MVRVRVVSARLLQAMPRLRVVCGCHGTALPAPALCARLPLPPLPPNGPPRGTRTQRASKIAARLLKEPPGEQKPERANPGQSEPARATYMQRGQELPFY